RLEPGCVERTAAGVQDRGQCCRQHRAFTQKTTEAGPCGCVENGDHLESVLCEPGSSRLVVSFKLAPEKIQVALDPAVHILKLTQRRHQLAADKHSNVLMQQPPACFECADDVMVDQKRLWQRRCEIG